MGMKTKWKLIAPLIVINSLGGLSYYFESSFFIPLSTTDGSEEKEKEKSPSDDELERIEIFKREQWPQIQEKVCPGGAPNLELESALFKLGREELEIADDRIFPAYAPRHDRSPKALEFYDGVFEVSVFMDGYDENNTFVYPSIWKCANNQIHSYLELVTNRDEDGALRDFNSAFGHWNDTIHWRLDTFRKIANEVREDLKDRGKSCLFTVVRDPIGRVLSGYNEVEYRLITGDEQSSNTLKMIKPPYTKVPNYDLNNTEVKAPLKDLESRFKAFVGNLVREHPSIKQGTNVYRHIHPMSKILNPLKRVNLLPSGKHWVLPLNKEFTEEFPKFLAQRCPRMTTIYRPRSRQGQTTNDFPGFPSMPLDGQHVSSEDPFGVYEGAKSVLKKAGPAIRALCHVYAPDYACFYGRNAGSSLTVRDIPAVCRDVYSSDLFRKAILD